MANFIKNRMWNFIKRTDRWTTRTCLKEYAKFERLGLPESERIFLVLSTRPGWRGLSKEFLREISSRLGTKEDVIQFIIISERHRLDRTHFPRFAAEYSPEEAAFSVAMLLASLGNKLLGEGLLEDAEIAQSLALRIEPDNSIAMLSLALNYGVTGRYAEAIPLFEKGLPIFSTEREVWEKISDVFEHLESFGPRENTAEMENLYREAYEECLKHVGGSTTG